jgi:hypothetical protein
MTILDPGAAHTSASRSRYRINAARPPVRPARAAMFTTVCTTLAVAGHLAAGRAAVAPRAVVVGFVGLYLVAWVVTGTERSLVTILGGLLGGQFMLHALFAAAAPGAKIVGVHAAHTGAADAAVMIGPGQAGADSGPTMMLAHVAAALVAAWWLRRGERAAWTLARRTAALAAYPLRALRSAAAALIDAVSVDALPVPAGPYDTARLIKPADVLLRGAVTRRGPPFGSMALTHR